MEQSKVYLDRTLRQLKILSQAERNLLVVSDLHLSEGFNEAEGLWSVNEDFFFSNQFARFLQFAEQQKKNRYGDAPWRLILNGDVFDFRQVGVPRDEQTEKEIRNMRSLEASRNPKGSQVLSTNEKKYGPGTSRLMSHWRVKRVHQGHRGFFQALAWFVACGNELVFIKGNHDIELHWFKVQMAIKSQLRDAYDDARRGGLYELDWENLPESLGRAELARIFFLPWNYYEPRRVYIEHGQQFHASDSEAHILWPVLPSDENLLELTLGDLFGRYLVNKLEELFPLMDNMKPFSKGLSWVLHNGIPLLLAKGSLVSGLTALLAHLKDAIEGVFLIREKTRKHGQSPSDFDEKRQAELAEYGDRMGLGADCARDLDKLKTQPQLRVGLSSTVLRLLVTVAVALLALAVATGLLALAGLNVLLSILVILGAAVALGTWRLKLEMLRPEKYLKDTAQEIHEVLLKHNKPVKYVIMGHDHHAFLTRLDDELKHKEGHFYVNSGTWTALIVHEAELVQNARQFSFVRVLDDTAHVMRWNDGGGSWEPIALH